MFQTMITNYDKRHDVLYIGLKDRSNSYGDEVDGLVYLRDFDTEELTGITVMGFLKMADSERLKDEFDKIGIDIKTVKEQIISEYF